MNSAIMMLENTVKKFPDKIAIRNENTALSFGEYRRLGMSVGTSIINNIVSSYDSKLNMEQYMYNKSVTPIVVYLPKSPEMLVCFAGIMYSGNPYVPVDENIPINRLCDIINSMDNSILITSQNMVSKLDSIDLKDTKVLIYEELIECKANEKLVMDCISRVIDCDPIYIMFTSGSTGKPKGVTIPHRGIIDYAKWLESTFNFDENVVLGNQSAFFFDNSTFDIYTMMYTGAEMVIIPEILFKFPTKLPDFIVENHINTIFWVPTVMIEVANCGILSTKSMTELKNVLFCGEVMPNTQLNIWREHYPDLMYANLYGPTEITDVCMYYVVEREFDNTEALPIGKPCRNMRAIVLTEDNSRAGIGETGELCIMGSAVSLGYWKSKDISDKVFIQNPLNDLYEERLYRTGDLAYVLEDGNFVFVGRKDTQIKLKGNRIELGESETIAKSLPEIENACVLFDSVNQEIVLFAQTTENLKLRKLNVEIKKYIPSYMVPTKMICLEKLPLTSNGKIDRVRLKKEYIDDKM